MVQFNSVKENEKFEEFLEEKRLEEKESNFESPEEAIEKEIPEEILEKAAQKYEYLESKNRPIYSKNLTEEEAEKIERIITRVSISYYMNNPLCQARTQIEDIRSEIVLKLINQAYEKETYEKVINGEIKTRYRKDKDGNTILKRDENGNLIVREVGIAVSVPQLASWIRNVANDLYRGMKRLDKKEDRNFNLDQQDRDQYIESGENRVYKESENARLAMKEEIDDGVNFKELTKIILEDNEGYREILRNVDPKLSPRKTEEMVEKIKKYVVFNAYVNASSNNSEIYKLYKQYESELSEEQRELLAECEARKAETGGMVTRDVMLKTFFGIGTGINAGSAWKITQFIPNLIKMKLENEGPDFLREAGIKLN